MKRLLIATDHFLPRWDGISRFLSSIIPSLVKHFEITVIAPDFGPLPKDFGVTMVRFPHWRLSINAFQPATANRKILAEQVRRADAVFIQAMGPIGLAARREAYKQNKPIIAYIHSIEWDLFSRGLTSHDFMRRLIRSVIKRAAIMHYNRCDLLLVPSLEVKELFTWMRISSTKRIIPLGVDTEYFSPSENKAKEKQQLGIDPSHVVIGYTGRLAREKSMLTLQRAFLRLCRRHRDVELLVVGFGIPSLEHLFMDKERMHFTGQRDNVVDYLRAMDIFVLPSLTETSSLCTMEAMSCAVAPVVTQVGLVKDYVQEGYNGLFFPKENSFALSKKLEQLLAEPKLLVKLQDNARKTIVSSYSWEKTVAQLITAINEYC
ncbi:hypothetical protein COY28_05115 [Candidatus Woesearchaeota archaeon CG_4_10_14_0_2_um_filter_57_5]|nr:MAG: hypothetical protein AUJ68_03325 [Candidatus Woesearchaeota archaeon CG1_02_57_44]PIN70881.1 MAG: hypothetical protein COV94_00780 [Candidatus Woesearchaeota archaeon CG11_big_fil_rev_8_21_14_0_20_57_5]PIZ51201.1 MAG: hypothetical protein COY28_05115 [Candidatus Woesearchaeota archaeon CG_4_10_14_0_2_um_filter_57_5]